ncbi:MAG: hypothetical protein IJ040_02835 [Lachnospiraceae bacterium]|nr:hypothetical protein [Lachnospiraceae bacterium]
MEEKKQRNRICLLFAMGAGVGLLFYILICGLAPLNVTEIAWMQQASVDIQQHYAGWCFFRNGDWQFPLGLTNRMTYPSSLSVFYTDSIPLIAIPLKLFRNWLPEQFQYLGFFGLVCFIMQGGMGSVITGKFIKSKVGCVLGAVLFVMCPVMLHRMYYHTALSAHFLVLIALYVWLTEEINWKRGLVIWGILGILCVGIEMYFLPMCGLVLLGYCAQRMITKKQTWWQCGAQILTFCLSALFLLWFVGGFYGEVASGSFGFGTFNANLNTLFNPLGFGELIPSMQVLQYQYEGFGYLGLGLIVMLLIGIVSGIINRVRKEMKLSQIDTSTKVLAEDKLDKETELITAEELVWYKDSNVLSWLCSAVGMIGIAFILAVGINGYLGVVEIWKISLPNWLMSICQIFRSSGRMIWVAVYIFYAIALVLLMKNFKKTPIIIGILAICCGLQIWDGNYWFEYKKYTNEVINEPLAIYDILEQYSSVVYLGYTGDQLKNEIGLFAATHNMTVSDFYLSRNSIDTITNRKVIIQDLLEGKVDDNTIYILNGTRSQNAYGLYVYNVEGCIFGVAHPIAELSSMKVEENEFFYFDPYMTVNTENRYGICVPALSTIEGNKLELSEGQYILEVEGEQLENLQCLMAFKENGQSYLVEMPCGQAENGMYYVFMVNEQITDVRIQFLNYAEQPIYLQKFYLYNSTVETE